MSIAQRIGTVHAGLETATRAGEFAAIAKCLAAGAGGTHAAANFAEQKRLPRRVVEILKAGVSAGTLGGSEGTALGDYGVVAQAWLDSLRNISAFDALLPSMVKIPLRTFVGISSLEVTGYVRGEGQAKTISQLQLAAQGLDPISVVAWVVLSRELATFSGPNGGALFDRELRAGVAAATDSKFVSVLTAGLSPITSAGSSVTAVRTDLAKALAEIETDVRSQIFVLVTAKTAKSWALSATEGGAPSFPGMTVGGGEIAGMRVLISSGVPDGEIIIVDAAQIVAASEGIELKSVQHSTIEMQAPPDSPATASTVLVSLWQNNLVALSAERHFGVYRGRESAVALITGASYSGDSPA